jgi:hypothetical protein
MSYAVVTTPEADADLSDVCAWYAEQIETENQAVILAVVHQARHQRAWEKRV